MSITSKAYGKLPTGEEVSLFKLTNANGLRAEIMNYGASLVSLCVPDREGNLADIVLGKDSLDEYVAGHSFLVLPVVASLDVLAAGNSKSTIKLTPSRPTMQASTIYTVAQRASMSYSGRPRSSTTLA